MAIQKRGILKNYFKTGCYPTEQQFSHVLDSFVHKNDKIGIDGVEGLSEALDSNAEKAVTDLKDYAETGKVLPLNGVYVYYGMPVHSRALEALDTDFDPEAQEGDTTEVIVFCCGHGDGSRSGKGSLYLVYHSTISGYAYYTRFTSQNVPEDFLRAFGEATATQQADGLMSKEDKGKLDNAPKFQPIEWFEHGDVLPSGVVYLQTIIPPSGIVTTLAEERHMFVYPKDTNGGYEAYDEPPKIYTPPGGIWCRVLHIQHDLYNPSTIDYYWIFDEDNRFLCRYPYTITGDDGREEEVDAPEYIQAAFWRDKDKKKLDAIKLLDINAYCVRKVRLPQDVENYNFFTKNGAPVEMRQWDSNSQKYLVFATLSLADMEEKALGTAPMEYRNSYYVFIDDDNGYYEYDREYSYGNVPMEIARAFHGEERREAVTDIFSL